MIGGGPSTGLGRIFAPPEAIGVEDELAAAYQDDSAQHGLIVEAGRPFIDWAGDVPEPKRPLDLVRYAFQRELYSAAGETDREIVVEKAAQIGVSAWLIRWALRRADLGNTVLYVMPRERQATEFSTMRLGPVVSASSYLRARQSAGESPTDTKRLKSIGSGYLAVRGSKSEDELVSVDADAVAMDEYDRLVQANLPRVEQRVTSAFSPGLLRRVSTPTFPNFGIAKEIKRTDERWWHVRCGCGQWTPMKGTETFTEVLDHETATLLCPGCRRPLDVREGEWVPTYTDGDRPRGYHMPKFVVPGIDLRGLLKRAEGTTVKQRQAHHNEDLGEEWQAENAGLTDEQLAAATGDYQLEPDGYFGFRMVTMGIDVAADAKGLHVRISEHLDEHRKKALWVGIIRDGSAPWGGTTSTAFEILTQVMERFRVSVAVIDHMPEPRTVRAWCERHRGRAYRASWSQTQKAVLTRSDPKGDPTKLSARYLEGIDTTVDLVRRRANLLPASDARPVNYDAHMKARVLSTLEPEADDPGAQPTNGRLRSTDSEIQQAWVKTGDDDYLQAEAYDVIATHMAYVHRQAGAMAQAQGHIVAPKTPDLVARQQEWADEAADDDLSYGEGPSDEPLGGW